MQSKILVIVGMHRSGTSLITQWLYKSGLHVGNELLGPDVGNVEGHFEDEEFMNAHKEILRAHELPATGITDKLPGILLAEELQKIEDLICKKSFANAEWGWKDPRTCLFLSHYRDIIPQAKYLIVLRDYQTVVRSLIKRDLKGMEKRYIRRHKRIKKLVWTVMKKSSNKKKIYTDKAEFYLKVWITYNRELLQHVRKMSKDQFIVISYHTLIKNSSLVHAHITDNWKMNLSFFDFKKIFKEDLITKEKQKLKKFITNKSLLSNADELFHELKQYQFIHEQTSKKFLWILDRN